MHLFCQLKNKSAGCPVEISKPRLFQSNRLGTNLTNFFKWNVFMSNSIQLLKVIADCCFQTVTGQFERFTNLLYQVLRSHENLLLELGICQEDLGTHSIQKGSAAYVSWFPGETFSGDIRQCVGEKFDA
jgi:hypothetical protein